jgi:HPt (histidine-containing phosphotransfer) domain-containing protein
VKVSDNGAGIAEENLTRIFVHGFTTKKDGHGFGLHSGVLAAREMGGSLTVQSAGAGRGATFTLKLPLTQSGDSRNHPPAPDAAPKGAPAPAAQAPIMNAKPAPAAQELAAIVEPAIAPESVEALRELATDADDDILTELIDTFLESAPKIVAEATEALSRRSPEILARAAHTLMGSSSNFGAKPLGALCAQLESLARSPDFSNSPDAEIQAVQLLDAIRRELERVDAALSRYRNVP